MKLQSTLATHVKDAVKKIYDVEIDHLEFQPTRKDFEGDITLVTFPMLKALKTNPVKLGEEIGNYLTENVAEVSGFNVVKGFLNIVLSDAYFLNFFSEMKDRKDFGILPAAEDAKGIMVEYSSPNTNKPLHLGHIRNILLGFSVAEILSAAGNKAYKTQIINDRGIHICKSMLAWERFGNGETPESAGIKGDKLVGNYYVKFDQEYKKEISELMETKGISEEAAKAEAPILVEAKQMLLKWEAGDPEVVALWEKMNQWVYDGFAKTYDALGVDFDKNYYESDTYLLGKDVVNQGLEKGVFYKKEDGSVWIDLTDEGLDEKIVLRSDGTAVYMTQDIGTAIQRVKDFDISGMVYTVGNEQDYHFKVLFLILKKLGFDWADYLYHLSYGMVDLPSGKMKSREGTVVDADDLIAEMTETARNISEELGKLDGYTEVEKEELYRIIGLGALKYYILKVDPKKRILFNPEESVDFQGNTGPFIQYTYARIQSIIRKADFDFKKPVEDGYKFHEKERSLIKQLQLYPETIQLAAENHSPALIANYTYELVKEFNSFYQNVTILGTEDVTEKTLRVQLANSVGNVIKSSFSLLGIQVPERM
ncbi:arginine--tRNA ligase [Salegentibacter mishustinae]|uniref:Arginine--tRNA ligase n=1 Tax=Salegentibacter mishustinae TaxID=270918 RepID=A0A0Q9ZIB8_9FLAO|nr:arginine--tRNA ligase [Salegentibacter mishustinae]KRG28535.1 arginine--tRNA ligase [Salegentibacter mishustinae]PNW22470.1 arginine--tRNA ligase [Salegentibacter mishustinae]PZX67710.1 arginyl-tRNA synthetase [Salegentibacter mishustinae]GGW77856.1 arginine--tRNA ligase [Salegentibacter mishustinae]